MKKQIVLHVILAALLMSSISCDSDEEEDFDLDLIDVNSPKLVKELTETYFPQDSTSINDSTMLEILYRFLLHESSDNIAIMQMKHDNNKKMRNEEQDMLSSAHAVQELVNGYKKKNGVEEFGKQDALNLLNREKYNEFINHFADQILEGIDIGKIDQDDEFDPLTDL